MNGRPSLTIGTTRPYPVTGLTTELWQDIPSRWVRFENLITTQDGVYLHALLAELAPMSRDPLPHVVAYQGRLYLEDGHTRVAARVLRGAGGMPMRVYESE